MWKAKEYTVRYDANGGSSAPSAQVKTHGMALTLSSAMPQRDGYQFKGWATTPNASAATYAAGGSYTANESVTLYAVWKANTYTVSYNANGGTGAPGSQTKTHDVDVIIPSQKPTRSEYRFLGWALSKDALMPVIFAGDSLPLNADTVLYAVWEADPIIIGVTPEIGVDQVTAPKGGTASVKIALKRNPGIASLKLRVSFDADLSLKSITYNSAWGGDSQQPQTMNSPVTLNWYNGAGNTNGDMVFATLVFEVSDEAAIGEHPITVTYHPNDVYNIAEENIQFAVINGGITVNDVPAEGLMQLSVGSATTRAGQTVDVPIEIADNAGIAGMVLHMSYSPALHLVGIKSGEALKTLNLTASADLSQNPVTLLWDGLVADETNGVIAVATFQIDSDAKEGDYPISLSYDDGTIYDNDLNDVDATITNGKITVRKIMPGDATGDNAVNAKDITMIRRHIAGNLGEGTIVIAAADVNRDNQVNAKDVTLIRRYIAGGFNVTLE